MKNVKQVLWAALVLFLSWTELPGAVHSAGLDPSFEQFVGGTADIKLKGSSVGMTQTSDTEWTLTKTGSVSGSTVSWTITATQGTTTSGLLIVNGTMTVTNTGTGGATIGNIVVNLQTKSGNTWITKSSDVADATLDDAATTAKIVSTASSEGESSFTENAASGQLKFMDAQTNSLFSLVPEVTVAPGTTKTLLFTATYDNNMLGLATGTSTRIEMIVSFGNAATSAASAPNIDINGNGIIDPDEARVRSVPSRLGVTVPAQVPGNATVTLSDALADIATTGTVTCTNAQFNLGATSGTVTITCDGGTDGGTVTNCAHLTSPDQAVNSGGFTFPTVDGLDLTACNTQTIGASTCTPGTFNCGWHAGDVVTHTETQWGEPGTPAANLLEGRFFTVYASVGYVEIGIPGAAGFSAQFSGPTAVENYLPSSGTPAPLNADLADPSSTSSGSFGGEVLALTLNDDLAPYTGGSAGVSLGSLTLCSVTPSSLNGTTVSGLLALANTLLGGGSNGYTITEILTLVAAVNVAFTDGAPSTFAQDHLVNGSCPTCTPGTNGCGWHTGDLVTYSQVVWGTSGGTAANLLSNRFFTVYPVGYVEIGLAGAAGFSAVFTAPSSVVSYLPASGTLGPLNADLIDPSSTASGAFGGEVLGLTLNIDFSPYTGGTSGIALGNLHLCAMTDMTLNNLTVSSFLGLANTLLGGGSNGYAISDLDAIAAELNVAFSGGAPITFAQDHLVNGSCPTCTPGTNGCGWHTGDVVTHTQTEWGSPGSSAANLLDSRFFTVYTSLGYVEIGLAGAAGFSAKFTGPTAVETYLPSTGTPAPLSADLVDPTSTASGSFGGEVLALTLNRDFTPYIGGSASVSVGSLTLCGVTPSSLDGTTVNGLLGVANTLLGGGTNGYTITDVLTLVVEVNNAFTDGAPSTFAQDHLVNGNCL